VPYIKSIKNYCDFQNISINELSLRYVTSNPNIDGVLMGVDSVKQLKDNLSCMNSENVTSIKKFVKTINVKEVELLNPVNWK
jgi:predicted aldo/keto reductase-like oxidoreductase